MALKGVFSLLLCLFERKSLEKGGKSRLLSGIGRPAGERVGATMARRNSFPVMLGGEPPTHGLDRGRTMAVAEPLGLRLCGQFVFAGFIHGAAVFAHRFFEQVFDLPIDAAHFLLGQGFERVVKLWANAEQE
jgi:hypothetical protein